MPRYERDPISEWFDRAAENWLERAYRHPGKWEPTYLAPPSQARRTEARVLYGETDLDAKDRWGEIRWVRAYKRALYYAHKAYGDGSGLRWETGGLIRKTGWPTRRRELQIMIIGDAADALAAAGRRPAARRWDLSEQYRSKPGPPDRPWDAG